MRLCRFDEVSSLRCEVARKNMYIKDDPNKRPRMAAPPAMGGYGYPPAAPGEAPCHGLPSCRYTACNTLRSAALRCTVAALGPTHDHTTLICPVLPSSAT